jgi:hypothetical protein
VAAPDILPPERPPRRYPSTLGGVLYLLALAGVLVGLALVVWQDWRTGVRAVAGALAFAAACRLVLPTRQAGMLAVRHRVVDVLMLLGVAGALFFLAGDIPNQPL